MEASLYYGSDGFTTEAEDDSAEAALAGQWLTVDLASDA